MPKKKREFYPEVDDDFDEGRRGALDGADLPAGAKPAWSHPEFDTCGHEWASGECNQCLPF